MLSDRRLETNGAANFYAIKTVSPRSDRLAYRVRAKFLDIICPIKAHDQDFVGRKI
jgi:hypothetical protein